MKRYRVNEMPLTITQVSEERAHKRKSVEWKPATDSGREGQTEPPSTETSPRAPRPINHNLDTMWRRPLIKSPIKRIYLHSMSQYIQIRRDERPRPRGRLPLAPLLPSASNRTCDQPNGGRRRHSPDRKLDGPTRGINNGPNLVNEKILRPQMTNGFLKGSDHCGPPNRC